MSDKPEEKCKRRTEALRPFRPHNNTCDFVFGYDRESVEKAIKAKDARIAELESALVKIRDHAVLYDDWHYCVHASHALANQGQKP